MKLTLVRKAVATEDAIIEMILAHEGSIFTNDAADAGGPTRWGITLAVLQSWRGFATIDDVRALTRDEAATIYRALYIRPFYMLPAIPLRVNVIDMGVNAGIRRAAMLLQAMVGADIDGHIGAQTLGKINIMLARADLNLLYVGFRLKFYEDLIQVKPVNIKWRNGWRNRALSFAQPQPKTFSITPYGRFGQQAKAA